jgi:alpha-beta hydrolase superfamily lysophospholipase
MSRRHPFPIQEVVGCAPTFEQDELPGFERATLQLPEEDDGKLAATLIRTKKSTPDDRPAVLYLHGFVDYFFQEHLAAAFEEAGFRFYALELRRYGRSIRPGNRVCTASNVAEYFPEIDWATNVIAGQHQKIAGLIAHSTGALIMSIYLSTRRPRHIADSMVLVSPFLRFNLRAFDRGLTVLVARIGRFRPDFLLPQKLKPAYGRTIHKSQHGEWDYDLSRKPLEGFPLYAGWFRMIRAAHSYVAQGLDLRLPILSMFSDRSRYGGKQTVPEDLEADLVLNVNHIRERSPLLGPQVELREIPGGVHDLTLSKKPVRDEAIAAMVRFIQDHSK